MSVFDVHVHVQPYQMMRPDVVAMIQGQERVRHILSSPDTLLRHLDEEGVERVCCINYVSPDVMGFTRESNDWIANFTKDHRDRLLPVGSVNPLHEKDSAAETRRVLDLGIRLIKINPPHQLFSPNAYRSDLPALAEVYAEAERREIPVMFHTGTSIFPRARNVFADPMPIDDVANDFPKLRIILAHAGRPLYGETAFFLLRRHASVMADVSGIPPRSLPTYLPRAKEIAGKLLWGTDWPSPGITSMAANIAAFRALGWGEEVERKVLWENAESLFGNTRRTSS
jgi:uncharacterized protein